MKTETQNLAALVRLALQNKTFIPVVYAEIISALTALQTASEIIPFSPQGITDLVAGLHEALSVLSGLVYIISCGKTGVDRRYRTALVKQANKLHTKLTRCLHECGYTQVIQ